MRIVADKQRCLFEVMFILGWFVIFCYFAGRQLFVYATSNEAIHWSIIAGLLITALCYWAVFIINAATAKKYNRNPSLWKKLLLAIVTIANMICYYWIYHDTGWLSVISSILFGIVVLLIMIATLQPQTTRRLR